MGLNVGNSPVKQVYVGSTPVKAVYVGSELVWSATVQITLGVGYQARDQFRAALTARGLDYTTITEIPFDIELAGSGEASQLFYGCNALTSVPPMDTSQVTNMNGMFQNCHSLVTVPPLDTRNVWNAPSMFASCRSLTSVPDMDTSKMTNTNFMFYLCSALTDGNVRLIGRHPNVTTSNMILSSGLTREPFYTTDGQPWPTSEVHEVTVREVTGYSDAVIQLVSVTVPAGETWQVRIQGTITQASGISAAQPFFRIGVTDSGRYGPGAAVDFSGTVTAANSTIAFVIIGSTESGFTGTVTIEK